MLFTKLTLCSQIRNIVLTVAMNLVFIYLGEECLVITYSASELVLWTPDVILFTDFESDSKLNFAIYFLYLFIIYKGFFGTFPNNL